MYRFYCEQLGRIAEAGEKLVELDAAESHHIRRVLRLGVGDTVVAFNGCGVVGRGVICGGSDNVVVRIGQIERCDRVLPWVSVAVAVPKGPRFDQMVNQLCQVGVDELIPLQTERGVVSPRGVKIDRVRRIAVEAAKQSGRAYMMDVGEMRGLEQVLGGAADLRLVCDVGGDVSRGVEQVEDELRRAERVLVLIGPEGGWTDREREVGRQAGCRAWTVNTGILRIETAAVAAAAIVRYVAGSGVGV